MMRPNLVLPAMLCAAAWSVISSPAAAASTGYSIFDDAHTFRGRIAYVAHRTDAPTAPKIAGTLSVGDTSWSVDERSASAIATAGNKGGSLQGGGFSTGVDDPLASGAIANAWAVVLGTLSAIPGIRAGEGDSVWQAARLRLYLDANRGTVAGLADTAGADDVTVAFDDWTNVGGVLLPMRVMRLRDGVAEASYSISDFSVMKSAVLAAVPKPRATQPREGAGSAGFVAAQPPIELQRVEFPWRFVSTFFGTMLLAVFVVAWTRRDAFVEILRHRAQIDPRGWQARGVSVFVSADGRLWFDGAEYSVGAQFYNRQAVVQSSPLFLRIGAREVPRAIVVARKFRIPALRAAKVVRSRSSGLSLIENIVAIGLFALVVVGAVYPTLAVMANGDQIARRQSDAVRLAANALNDEEVASSYGAVSDGSVRSQAGDLTVVVTVGPSQTGVSGSHDIDVAVQDAAGRSLAHAVSTVGPAVLAPPPPNHTPNPSPAPTG